MRLSSEMHQFLFYKLDINFNLIVTFVCIYSQAPKLLVIDGNEQSRESDSGYKKENKKKFLLQLDFWWLLFSLGH